MVLDIRIESTTLVDLLFCLVSVANRKGYQS